MNDFSFAGGDHLHRLLHIAPRNSSLSLVDLRPRHAFGFEPIEVDVVLTESRVRSHHEDHNLVVGNATGTMQIFANYTRKLGKKSFHLHFASHGILGQTDVLLRAQADDPTRVRELLMTELYSAMGVGSYRMTAAQVFFHDMYAGVYMMTEWLDWQLWNRLFGQPGPGATVYNFRRGFNCEYLGQDHDPYARGCYNVSRYQSSLGHCLEGFTPSSGGFCCKGEPLFTTLRHGELDATPDVSEIVQLVTVITMGSDEELAELVDMESLLRLMVVDLVTNQWDGFWRSCSNYLVLLMNRSAPFFRVVPLDSGQAFTDLSAVKHTKWDNNCCRDSCFGRVHHLAHRALTGVFRSRFLTMLEDFIFSIFRPGNSSPLRMRIVALHALLRPALIADDVCKGENWEPFICPSGGLDTEFQFLTAYVHDRACFLYREILHDVICYTSWPACQLSHQDTDLLHSCGVDPFDMQPQLR